MATQNDVARARQDAHSHDSPRFFPWLPLRPLAECRRTKAIRYPIWPPDKQRRAGYEIDSTILVAALTILGFSVHDTIVVFDRIREMRKGSSAELYEFADIAISETMVRSLNNSFTIIFMLLALILLGGDSVRWFAVALLVGRFPELTLHHL